MKLGRDILRGMFTEFILTAMLVIVYVATAEDFHNRVYTKTLWPLAVGLATAAGMLGGNSSGGAMNPASGVAAALAYWDVRNLAAYLFATISGAVFGALVYLKLLGNDLNDSPLRPQSVFEGVRQETKEFGRQNFIMYVVVDFVHDRLSSDPFETRFSGRVCYPQMHNAVSQIEGMVTNDGKVLRVTELGGMFRNAQIQGYMPDTGHMAGVQVTLHMCILEVEGGSRGGVCEGGGGCKYGLSIYMHFHTLARACGCCFYTDICIYERLHAQS